MNLDTEPQGNEAGCGAFFIILAAVAVAYFVYHVMLWLFA